MFEFEGVNAKWMPGLSKYRKPNQKIFCKTFDISHVEWKKFAPQLMNVCPGGEQWALSLKGEIWFTKSEKCMLQNREIIMVNIACGGN